MALTHGLATSSTFSPCSRHALLSALSFLAPFHLPHLFFFSLHLPLRQVKTYKYLLGFNSIFTFFKILKYLSHIPMFARLVNILGACLEDVASFLINCGISFLAFAGAFHLTYGNHMAEFATMGESFMTLYRFSMGDWDVGQLQSFQVTPHYVPVFLRGRILASTEIPSFLSKLIPPPI